MRVFHEISTSKRWPTTHILLITPPPIDEAARLLYPFAKNTLGLPERTDDAAGAYAKACVDVAGECGTPVVDLWTRMQQFPDWQKAYLRDGLHLTRAGNRIVFKEVVKKLGGSGLNLETLPVDLPLISAIDPNDPLKSFEE
ncbi:hypothetical protein RJ639_015310 [Escallonia herrerae]|uniref:SGNH hydrolase-type esterase domain-containing protein n=1 Tax=Escallonia herrerae TaxID=1293975 RepID=A0AA88VGY8_9ASTE|nr:hypothetical protein RJ639_015310 [Escallonia herrerae]